MPLSAPLIRERPQALGTHLGRLGLAQGVQRLGYRRLSDLKLLGGGIGGHAVDQYQPAALGGLAVGVDLGRGDTSDELFVGHDCASSSKRVKVAQARL